MVEAVEAKETPDEETLQWIAWAKAKADWYDPTVAEPDVFFGKRNHSESSGEKTLRERNSYYWYTICNFKMLRLSKDERSIISYHKYGSALILAGIRALSINALGERTF